MWGEADIYHGLLHASFSLSFSLLFLFFIYPFPFTVSTRHIKFFKEVITNNNIYCLNLRENCSY